MGKKKFGRLVAAAVLAVAGLGLATFIASNKVGDLPFDGTVWKTSPASERWAVNNLRYHMRKGATAAARACGTGEEVAVLLGNPDGSGDYARSNDDKDPAYSHLYDLGMVRQPLVFWEASARVQLEVVMDRRGRVLSAEVREEKLNSQN